MNKVVRILIFRCFRQSGQRAVWMPQEIKKKWTIPKRATDLIVQGENHPLKTLLPIGSVGVRYVVSTLTDESANVSRHGVYLNCCSIPVSRLRGARLYVFHALNVPDNTTAMNGNDTLRTVPYIQGPPKLG